MELKNNARAELTNVNRQLADGPGSPTLRERKTILDGIISQADQRATTYGNELVALTSPTLIAPSFFFLAQNLRPFRRQRTRGEFSIYLT